MTGTTVLNRKTDRIPDEAVYIGRGRGSRWGNPYRIGVDGTRDEVIAKFRRDLWRRLQSGDIAVSELAAMHGKTLVCWCAPLPCHGHVLAKAAAWAAGEGAF